MSKHTRQPLGFLLTAACENTLPESFGVLQIYIPEWSFRDCNEVKEEFAHLLQDWTLSQCAQLLLGKYASELEVLLFSP